MNVTLVILGVLVVGYAWALSGRRRYGTFAKLLVGVGLLLVVLGFPPRARAAEILEIRDVAVLTDERGTCPRDHAIAIFPDRVRGCWTIGEHNRITRIYRDGKLVAEYSSLRLEIYGRLL